MFEPTTSQPEIPAQIPPPRTNPDAPTIERAGEATAENLRGPISSPTSSGTDHFDAIRLGPVPGETVESDTAAADDAAGNTAADGGDGRTVDDIMSPDDFFDVFRFIVGAPNYQLEWNGVEPLKSLEIAPDDKRARKASDAIYDTMAESPFLRRFLNPKNKWLERAASAGLFGWHLRAAVREEIIERAREEARTIDGTAEPGDDVSATAENDGAAADVPRPARTTKKTEGGTFHEVFDASGKAT